jgi:hypothetical protein
MVFTVTMPWGWGQSGPVHARRSVLIGAAAVTAAGLLSACDLNGDEPEVVPPPDAAALRQVAGEALDLAGRYDAAIEQGLDRAGTLTAIRDAHREHAAAIGRSLDASVAPSAGPSASGATGSGGAVRALQAAERAAAERAAAACVAVAAHYAPLLGTVAAARASHAEALQSTASQ